MEITNYEFLCYFDAKPFFKRLKQEASLGWK